MWIWRSVLELLDNYEPSLAALAANLAPRVAGGLWEQAYQILTEKFATLESVGPSSAAQVAEENGQDREQAQQAAFQDAQDLFANILQMQKPETGKGK